ncbi:MAG: hypothetical protein HUU37_04215 [Bdellovibrionales bacterium]|nr:hypothetical protein [Bdellovibrionales bacterium]
MIALEPADAEYRSSMTLRSEWVKRFQEAYRNKRREVEFELLRSGAFETEQSVRFWYEQFGAAPSFKIEAGKHYVSVPTDFSVSVSERQWRLSRPISASGSDIFSWRYDESEMVSVPNFPGRPAGVTIPAPQTFLTDVFLMGMDVGFVQKTVSFGLNPAYEANLRDSGCGTNWDRLLMEVSFGAAQVLSMAYFPLGLVAVGYWIYRLVVWFKSKKRRGAQPPPLPPPTIS